MNEQNNQWVNHGDINFLAYGGCLTKKDPDIENRYLVFRYDPEIGDAPDGKAFAAEYTVDLDDLSDEDINDILTACGCEDDEHVVGKTREEIIEAFNPELMAIESVTALGKYVSIIDHRGMWADDDGESCFVSRDQLVSWLKDIGADSVL